MYSIQQQGIVGSNQQSVIDLITEQNHHAAEVAKLRKQEEPLFENFGADIKVLRLVANQLQDLEKLEYQLRLASEEQREM